MSLREMPRGASTREPKSSNNEASSSSQHYRYVPKVQIITKGKYEDKEKCVETVMSALECPPDEDINFRTGFSLSNAGRRIKEFAVGRRKRVAFAKDTHKSTNGISILNGVEYWSAGKNALEFSEGGNGNKSASGHDVIGTSRGNGPNSVKQTQAISGVEHRLVNEGNKVDSCTCTLENRNEECSLCYSCLFNKACDKFKQNEFNETVKLLSEILRGHVQMYGEESCEVGSDLHNIGIVLIRAGNYDKALSVCEEAVQIRRTVLGSNHADLAVSLVEKGIVLLAREAFDDALVHFSEALAIRRDVYGSNHPQVANVLNNIGCVHMELGELDHALDAYTESLSIQKAVTSETHEAESHILTIAALQSNIGCIMLKKKEYDSAAAMFDEILLVQRSVLGDIDPSILLTLDRLGYANAMTGEYDMALKIYDDLLRCQKLLLGPEHTDCTQTIRKLGNLYIKKREFKKALVATELLLSDQEKQLPSDDPELMKTKRVVKKLVRLSKISYPINYVVTDDEATASMDSDEDISSKFSCTCRPDHGRRF